VPILICGPEHRIGIQRELDALRSRGSARVMETYASCMERMGGRLAQNCPPPYLTHMDVRMHFITSSQK
jgi:hypothetical protein